VDDCAAYARAAYGALAPLYDAFTAHHDYDAWTAELEALARECGLAGSRLLDVGCGTGKSFLPFLARGWTVAGCDLSGPMVRIAAAKAPGVPLTVCDMRSLPVLGRFDIVACIDDGMNYLLETRDLERAFAGMRRNLAAGGLVIFDVNTLATYRGFFASSTVTQTDSAFLVWHGLTRADAPPGVLAEAAFTAFSRRGNASWSRTDSHHRQRHHPPDVINAAVRRAGLEVVAVHGQGLDGRPRPGLDESTHTKAIYVARAAGAS
jgi:SAM-dependent methyltransferase